MPQTTVGLPSQISPMTDFTSTTDPLDTYSAGSAGTFTPFSCSAGYSSSAIPGHRNSYSILWLKFGRLNGHTTPYPHYIIQSKNVNKQKCTHQTKHIMLFSFYSWWVKSWNIISQNSFKSSTDLCTYRFCVISRWAYIPIVVRIPEWPIDSENVARSKSGSFLWNPLRNLFPYTLFSILCWFDIANEEYVCSCRWALSIS